MVIDISVWLIERERRIAWSCAEMIPELDPTGSRFRVDMFGRLIQYDSYNLRHAFGWGSFPGPDGEDRALNQRSVMNCLLIEWLQHSLSKLQETKAKKKTAKSRNMKTPVKLECD